MFYSFNKNVALIGLLMLSSSSLVLEASAAQPTSFIETVKNSRGLGKWLGTIVPCTLATISAHVAFKMNKDRPDRKDIVATSRVVRLLSFMLGCFFLSDWIDTDFKSWSLSKSF